MINIYKQAINGFLVNDLTAFDSEENDHQLIYHLKKGPVQILGEFSSQKYEIGCAYVIYAEEEVISVDKELVKIK